MGGRTELIQAVGDRLDNDTILSNLVQEVSFHDNPDNPKQLSSPLVVFLTIGGPDADDLHGAASNPEFEFRIWGYDKKMIKDAEKAAERITELMLSDFSLSDGSEAFRFTSITGWEDNPQEDPKTIFKFNRMTTRLWSQNRIDALGAQS